MFNEKNYYDQIFRLVDHVRIFISNIPMCLMPFFLKQELEVLFHIYYYMYDFLKKIIIEIGYFLM